MKILIINFKTNCWLEIPKINQNHFSKSMNFVIKHKDERKKFHHLDLIGRIMKEVWLIFVNASWDNDETHVSPHFSLEWNLHSAHILFYKGNLHDLMVVMTYIIWHGEYKIFTFHSQVAWHMRSLSSTPSKSLSPTLWFFYFFIFCFKYVISLNY